jgi:trimethylamine--corrinoid protein Co-methyltransferase
VREGILVDPTNRLSPEQINVIDAASIEILEEIGLLCFNEEAVEIFNANGAHIKKDDNNLIVQIPEKLVRDAIDNAPSVVVLGARDPDNSLVLDSKVPRVYFVSGAEANSLLEYNNGEFHSRQGRMSDLADSAHLAENLSNLDAFIRNVNIQDKEVTDSNKDVLKFFLSLDNCTKHVMAGLTRGDSLDEVLKMASIIAGGDVQLLENPIISFICCVVKSPLQFVDDTTTNLISIVKSGMPVVISSSPQGGSTAPITEEGMLAQINSEILAGIVLSQMVRPGTSVLYGSVPTRARLDNLLDSYGMPEFGQYNAGCVQLARHYRIPCYSTAGVSDSKIPGIQTTMEKLLSYLYVTASGPQYLHYAFGLLDHTATFSPLQAVMDDAQIDIVKALLRKCTIAEERVRESIEQIRQVFSSSTRLFARHIRKSIRTNEVYTGFPFESKGYEDETLDKASNTLDEIMKKQRKKLEPSVREKVFNNIKELQLIKGKGL